MKSLTTLIEGAEITPEHLAKNPPKFIPPEHHELWSHLVLKKQHRTYGSAVSHFKHHTKKWGYALTLLTMSVIDEYDPLIEDSDEESDASEGEKDGDNDGKSSAEVEGTGFNNKFNKRFTSRAFGHALRAHRRLDNKEESMSNVIDRAKQVLGLDKGVKEAFSKMPGGGLHLPATVKDRHHTTSIWDDEFPGIKTNSDWSSRVEIPTGKVTYTKHQHHLVNTLLGHGVGEDTPWEKMPKLDYSYLHSTTAAYKDTNKGVALAVSRRDPSHRVLLNHDSTVNLHHLKGDSAEKLQVPDGVGRSTHGNNREIYSPVHVNKVLQHHFGHSDFDFYKPDYSKSKGQKSGREIYNKAADLQKHQTGRIQPSATVGDKFLSTVHSNRHNEIRDNIHAHVNDVMGHINHMLSGGTPQHGEYGRHPAIEKLRNSLNALEDMHDEIRKTHYKGWRGDTGREPMTVDQLLRTRKKATQAATGSDRY